MRNVKIIRIITGEDVICNFIEDEGGTYMMEPMQIYLKGNGDKYSVMMDHWLPIEIIGDNITRVNPRNIISVFEPNDSISEYYSTMMDKINKILINKAKIREMEEDGVDMDDVMNAIDESQSETLH